MEKEFNAEEYIEKLDKADQDNEFDAVIEAYQRGKEAVPHLLNLLEHIDQKAEKTRWLGGIGATYFVLLNLYLIRDRRAVPQVVQLLENSLIQTAKTTKTDYFHNYHDWKISNLIACCYTLGAMGDPAAVPSLLRVLTRFGEDKLISDRYCLKAAADALVRIGKESVKPLTELLNSQHTETRKYAAYALGKLGDKRAYPALVLILNNSKGLVREAAGRALLQIDSKNASKTVNVDNLVPAEKHERYEPRNILEHDSETVRGFYGTVDELGPPSDYKYSFELYNYAREWKYGYYYEEETYERKRYYAFKGVGRGGSVLKSETVEEMTRFQYQTPLCLCGEYLEWKYLYTPSRVYYTDCDEWTYLYDFICVYCRNCKRYFGLIREEKEEYSETRDINSYYLPRFPKESELVDQSRLDGKEWKKWRKGEKKDEDEEDEDEDEEVLGFPTASERIDPYELLRGMLELKLLAEERRREEEGEEGKE